MDAAQDTKSATRTSRREPCGNCPFLRSAPLAHWCPEHYVMLADNKVGEGDFVTSQLFACHKDARKANAEQGLCVGWMLDQRERGVPSLALRMALRLRGDSEELQRQLSEIHGREDCYETVEELVRLNLEHDKKLYPMRYEDSEL